MTEVVKKFPGKYGEMDVSLSKLSNEQFEDIRLICDTVDGIVVYAPSMIIKRYSTVGNKDKQAKRDLRVALLKLVAAKQPITRQGVENNKPKAPNLVLQLASGAANLRSTKTEKK